MESFADHGITVPSRGGAERYTTCPRCSSARKVRNRRKPCLSVNIDKGVWNCNHCGWKGGLKTDGTPSPVRVASRPITYTAPQAIHAQVLEYLLGRGLTQEVLERNHIKSSPRKFAGETVQAIHFPYFKDGVVVNVKYRTKDKRFSQESGAEKIVYGYDDIMEQTIIVEGEFDKLALEVCGFQNVISVPDGAPALTAENYASKFDYLENCENKLQTVEQFVLAVDNDAPGQKLEAELSRRLGRYRCARVVWPADCKDANDVLLKHGMEKLIECIYSAKDYPLEGFIDVSDDDLSRFYASGITPGQDPGWRKFKELYTVKRGELTVVTAAPNSGKSEFIDALLVNLATLHDWRFVIYSPENAPVQVHITKLIEKRVGKTAQPNYLGRMSEAEYLEAAKWVRERFYFINPEESGKKLSEVLEMTESLIFRKGIDGLVIDPWNELDHDCPRDVSETLFISKSLSQIRGFARQNEVHVWLVAHPTKLQKIKDKASNEWVYPPATPYDISGSAHWFNKADNCLSVFRTADDHQPITVFVQKVRFKTNGRRGSAHFRYDTRDGRYTEV